jgi:hypothetical protein
MELFDSGALIKCIKEAVRTEIEIALKQKEKNNTTDQQNEKLLTKKEMAEELDISLVTLTDWMKKGLPYHRMHRRIYFYKEEVLKSMEKF